MAILGVDDFKSKLVGGGARSNMFKVTCNFPAYAQGDVELSSFMIKGAQFPSSVVAPVPVLFRGRQLQLAGDRTFEPVTLTVINDTGFEVRDSFERWMNGMNNMTDNEGLTNPNNYQVDIKVDHLDRNGATLKTYILRGAFPTTLDDISLSASDNDSIEDFGCSFTYQYFETDTTT